MGKTKTVLVSEEQEKKEKKQKTPDKKRKAKAPGLKGGERVVAVSGEELPEKEEEKVEKKKRVLKKKVRGKKYLEATKKIDRNKNYSLDDAVKLVGETSYTSFDATVELHLVVKKKGLSINVNLPFSSGKEKKVEVANEKTIENLKKGKVDFDLLLATKEDMPKLVPFAKILGPKGLMPNPKNGTIISKPADAKKFSGNSLTLKTEKKAPLVHIPVGKVSQKKEEVVKNIETIVGGVGKRNIIKAHLSSTMGPSVRLKIS